MHQRGSLQLEDQSSRVSLPYLWAQACALLEVSIAASHLPKSIFLSRTNRATEGQPRHLCKSTCIWFRVCHLLTQNLQLCLLTICLKDAGSSEVMLSNIRHRVCAEQKKRRKSLLWHCTHIPIRTTLWGCTSPLPHLHLLTQLQGDLPGTPIISPLNSRSWSLLADCSHGA